MRNNLELSRRHPLLAALDEALTEAQFASSWGSEADPSFRAFAAAAITLHADLSRLPPTERRSFYVDLTRRKRAPLLASLSGVPVAAGVLGLFAKIDWVGMRRSDWRRLLTAASEPELRKPLGHMPLITSRLLRQLRDLPVPMLVPRVMMILNYIDLGASLRRALREISAAATPPQMAALGAAAQRIVTLGDFWDFWQSCVAHGGGDDSVDAFGMPQEAFASQLLAPITSPEDLAFEGRQMRNCLGSMSWRASTGRTIFFRSRSDEPFDAELRRVGGRWTPGSILGVGNANLEGGLRSRIEAELETIAATLPTSRAYRQENFLRPEIDSWRAYARERFSEEEIAYLTRRLVDTFPAPGTKIVEPIYYGRAGCRRMTILPSHEGDSYRLDLTSHQDDGVLALYITSRTLPFLQEVGFDWPRRSGSRSFMKQFKIRSKDDCRAIAEIALAILGKVYNCRAGAPPFSRYETINPVPDYGTPYNDVDASTEFDSA